MDGSIDGWMGGSRGILDLDGEPHKRCERNPVCECQDGCDYFACFLWRDPCLPELAESPLVFPAPRRQMMTTLFFFSG